MQEISKKRLRFLQAILFAGSAYYVVGFFAHWFGLTISPWFDGALYSPYHDSIIAMASLAFAGFFFVSAINPVRNYDSVRVIIFAAFINGLLTFYMAFTVDFSIYGSAYKQDQAFAEAVLLIVLSILLAVFIPKIDNKKLESKVE
jgi:hypothetical protein